VRFDKKMKQILICDIIGMTFIYHRYKLKEME